MEGEEKEDIVRKRGTQAEVKRWMRCGKFDEKPYKKHKWEMGL